MAGNEYLVKAKYDPSLDEWTVIDYNPIPLELRITSMESSKSSTGVKNDQEKTRVDLLDAEFLEGVGRILAFGANKYDAHNWRGGISFHRILGAILRHTFAIMRGEDIDPESGEPHSLHVGCNAMFLFWMMKHRPDLDDRYKHAIYKATTT